MAKQDAVAQCGYSAEKGDRRKNDEKSYSDPTMKLSVKGKTGRDTQYEERLVQDTAGTRRRHNGTSQGGERGGRTGTEGMPLNRDSRP